MEEISVAETLDYLKSLRVVKSKSAIPQNLRWVHRQQCCVEVENILASLGHYGFPSPYHNIVIVELPLLEQVISILEVLE